MSFMLLPLGCIRPLYVFYPWTRSGVRSGGVLGYLVVQLGWVAVASGDCLDQSIWGVDQVFLEGVSYIGGGSFTYSNLHFIWCLEVRTEFVPCGGYALVDISPLLIQCMECVGFFMMYLTWVWLGVAWLDSWVVGSCLRVFLMKMWTVGGGRVISTSVYYICFVSSMGTDQGHWR